MILDKKVNIIGPMSVNTLHIDENLFSIIVDGGLNHNLNLHNSLSIGDNDSTKSKIDCVIPKEKERSDLHFALEKIPKDTLYLELHGFMGGRHDHQLMLYGDLCHYLENSKVHSIKLYDENKHILSILNSKEESIEYKGEFSLFSFYSQRIQLDGDIKYKVTEANQQAFTPYSSQGLSNISYSLIQISFQKPLLIFFNA